MGPSSAEQADNSGPLEKRIVSKNWSVRAGAFDELTKKFKDAQVDSKDGAFQEYIGMFKTHFLKDSNPGALEKALDCLKACLEKIRKQTLGEEPPGLLAILIEKCVGHVKPTIKAKSLEVMHLLFVVSEDFVLPGDTLREMASHKNVKVSNFQVSQSQTISDTIFNLQVLASGNIALAELFKAWGPKKFKLADYEEVVLKAAQSTNPGAKTAAYEFYKACYYWVGEGILLRVEDKLKKAQIDDLKKLFEKVKEEIDAAGGKKVAMKTRTEEAQAAEDAKNAAIDAAMAEEA